MIHAEITMSAEVIKTVAATSLEAAAQLAALDDALHLVLLEVTELTTQLYAVRSRLGRSSLPALSQT